MRTIEFITTLVAAIIPTLLQFSLNKELAEYCNFSGFFSFIAIILILVLFCIIIINYNGILRFLQNASVNEKIRTIISIIILFIVLLVIIYGIFSLLLSSFEITSPKNGESVSIFSPVEGKGAVPGHDVTVDIYHESQKYHTTSVHVYNDGTWRIPEIQIGDGSTPNGTKFELYAITKNNCEDIISSKLVTVYR